MVVIDPRGLTALEWCDYTGDNMSGVVSVMKIRDGDEWRQWGAHALNVLRRRGVLIPDPYQAAKFEAWAMRFNQLIQGL